MDEESNLDLEQRVFPSRFKFVVESLKTKLRVLDKKDKFLIAPLVPALFVLNYIGSFFISGYSEEKRGYILKC